MNSKLAGFLKALGIGTGVSIGIILFVALIIVGPLLFIWSVNTLFNFQIAYTAWNWFVAVILLGCIRGS
jgi:hypothetical protein